MKAIKLTIGLLLALFVIGYVTQSKERRGVTEQRTAPTQPVHYDGFAAQVPTPKTAESNRWESRENRWSAALTSQKFVRDKLKAPTTAKFQDSIDADVTHIGGGRYVVNSYVDSQNVFGAMLRTKYRCELTDLGDGKWQLTNLRLFE